MNKIYPKNSFERFGDDLCQLLLSYLSFEDKLKFECVSKQWKSLIFNKVFKFQLINSKFKNKLLILLIPFNNVSRFEIFESLIRKCHFINELIIDNNCKCDENILNIICDYYENSFKYLKTISICLKEDTSIKCLVKFSQIYGKQLNNISIDGISYDKFSIVLSLFGNNLKSINFKLNLKSLSINNSEEIFLSKLEEVFITNCLTEDFEIFVHKFKNQLKKLTLNFTNNENSIKNILKLVSLLESLQVLRLEIELFSLPQINLNEEHMIDESLKLIGEKCLKLYLIDVCIFGDLISDNLFTIFGKYFRQLKYLSITLWDNELNLKQTPNFGTINTFGVNKSGEKLEKLSLMFTQLCDQHLKDIDLFLPNLTAIKLNTDQDLTDETLRHLSKLKHLKTIILEGNINMNSVTLDGILEFINNCSQTIKTIDIEFTNGLNEVSYDIFIAIAEMTPHINYFISFCDYENRYKDVCVYANLKNNLHVFKI
jgi:hypothetical protein